MNEEQARRVARETLAQDNVRQFKPRPPDSDAALHAEAAHWMLRGEFELQEWGQIIAALQMSPYDRDRELADKVHAAVGRAKHPSNQGRGAS